MYELKDREGRTAPVVIKATRKGALIANTRREWAVGQRLVALGPGDSPLPGFMKVGPSWPHMSSCIASGASKGRSRSAGEHRMALRGMAVDRLRPLPAQSCGCWG